MVDPVDAGTLALVNYDDVQSKVCEAYSQRRSPEDLPTRSQGYERHSVHW